MTETVRKGAGRPAHLAKRNRHAQRNPVSKGVSAETLKAALEGKQPASSATPDPKPSCETKDCIWVVTKLVRSGGRTAPTCDNHETKTVHRVKESNRRKGFKAPVTVEPISPAPASESDAPVSAEPAGTETPAEAPEAGTRGRTAEKTRKTAPKTPKAAGSTKAETFKLYAAESGWAANLDRYASGEGEKVLANSPDQKETIEIYFLDNKLDLSRMPTYNDGNRTVQLRNASAAKAQISGSYGRLKGKPVAPLSGRRSRRTRAASEDAPRLPFDLNAAADAMVVEAVKGKTISWRNRTTGEIDSAQVPEKAKVTITEHPQKKGSRTLNWNGDRGARSVLVSKIVSIG